MARPHSALIELAACRAMPLHPDDPHALVASAIEHRMDGLLWGAVERGEVEVPRDQAKGLGLRFLRARRRSQAIWEHASELSRLMVASGLEPVLLKGVAAEELWYNRRGERPCLDLDVWIDPSDRFEAIDDLVGAMQPDHDLIGSIGGLMRSGLLQSVDVWWKGIPVDLHVDPLKLGRPSQVSPLLRRTTVPVGPDGIPALDASATLLVLVLHGFKDLFSLLARHDEIRRLLAVVDLDLVRAMAWDEGVERWLAAGIKMVCRDLSLNPPPTLTGVDRLHAAPLLLPSARRLRGARGSRAGSRSWYLIPLTTPGRRVDGWRWISSKSRVPRDLAIHNLRLVRGPRLFAGLRRRQLARMAAQDERDTS